MEHTDDDGGSEHNSSDSGNDTLADFIISREKGKEKAQGKQKAKGKEKVKINPRRDRYVPCLSESKPGGPEIPDLLISYEGHVTCHLWDNAGVSAFVVIC